MGRGPGLSSLFGVPLGELESVLFADSGSEGGRRRRDCASGGVFGGVPVSGDGETRGCRPTLRVRGMGLHGALLGTG